MRDIFAADIDGDGDTDIVAGTETDDIIGWYSNNGDGTFAARESIATSYDAPDAVHVCDIDSDGDLDVFGAARLDSLFSWWENLGAGVFGPEQTVADAGDGVGAASDIKTGDVNGDDLTDVLIVWRGSGADILWFAGDGAGNFASPTPLGVNDEIPPPSNMTAIEVADLDGDMDLDVMYCSTDSFGFRWAENTAGDGSAWETHIVRENQNGFDVIATDLDADGDQDIIGMDDQRLMWFRNDNGLPPTFTGIQIGPSHSSGRSVIAVDFDGDGDTDLVAGHGGSSNICWHENDGAAAPVFATHLITPAGAIGVQAVVSGNFDGDCDLDVAAASFSDNHVTWFETDSPASACSPADLATPFCQLDFSDVVEFLNAFGVNGAAADLAEPFGQWDFSDVIAFLTLFGAGCG